MKNYWIIGSNLFSHGEKRANFCRRINFRVIRGKIKKKGEKIDQQKLLSFSIFLLFDLVRFTSMLFVQESIILYELFMRYESNAIVIEFDVTETTTVTMTRESEMKKKKKHKNCCSQWTDEWKWKRKLKWKSCALNCHQSNRLNCVHFATNTKKYWTWIQNLDWKIQLKWIRLNEWILSK